MNMDDWSHLPPDEMDEDGNVYLVNAVIRCGAKFLYPDKDNPHPVARFGGLISYEIPWSLPPERVAEFERDLKALHQQEMGFRAKWMPAGEP